MGGQHSTQNVTRKVHIGQLDSNQFPDNKIVSSKYTLWTFLPKNLYEQFRRFANICFACITLMSLFHNGPVSPVVYVFPICTIMSATAIKQGYEDICRHRADVKANMSSVTVLRRGCLLDIPCKHVRVGDIVCLHNEEDVPCDMVLLLTSQLDGKCFITTANLDGETNLKVMECPTNLNLKLDDLGVISGFIECENPSPNLYNFSGYIHVEHDMPKLVKDDENSHVNEAFTNDAELNLLSVKNPNQDIDAEKIIKKAPLAAENVLLRGSRLKTTSYIYGCAVYTGQETKLALNSRLSKNKFSTVERTVNWFLLFFFIVLIFEACLSTAWEWLKEEETNKFFYLGFPQKLIIPLELFNYIMLYYYIIPTSMYITIELQRFLGVTFFQSDLEMFSRGRHAICNTSDLNEELGQVQYMFTDKTGTLTENEMEFQRCSIDGKMYYEEQGKLYILPSNGNSLMAELVPSEMWNEKQNHFFLALAICHTVQCDQAGKDIQFQASSTDEKAFVEACARCDFVFLGTINDTIKVRIKGELKLFRRLEVLEFTSDRKRMSVIVMDENDTIWLFCKGAETSLLPLIEGGFTEENNEHLQDFSSRGLRTLVVGCRQLSINELTEGRQKLFEARSTLNTEIKEELINSAFLYLENNLQVLGITAVEDRLQEYVPETLASLHSAGIKVWVLTGDKVETAKSIAYSCGHFKTGTDLIHLTELTSVDSCLRQLDYTRQKVSIEKYRQYGLVVDGSTLSIILSHNPEPFIELAMSCSAVICCRLSPKQKAQVVHLVKHSPKKPITLAVGDGANDISMIQEAHIGIGIMGKEGQQAVCCSDFAFAQFHFLIRALFVHGHWYYLRAANLILYFFYKNIVFITPQVYFAFGQSPQVLYCALFLLLYNTLFTAIPIVLYGLIEQDFSARTLISYPVLYKYHKNNKLMSFQNFMLWMLFGAWHSIVIYFVPYFTVFNDSDIDLNTLGTAVLHFAIIIVNLKLLLHSQYWTYIFVISIITSILGFIGFTLFYSTIFSIVETQELDIEQMFGIHLELYTSLWFWELLILCIVLSLLPDLLCRHLEKSGLSLIVILKPSCFTSSKSFNVKDMSTYEITHNIPQC
ncbi:phospholipid-transporting ATPase IF-like [Lycorma delicatula]|uniref:phospholipid-transporting ATPase IF-like n=1 Tax=Lycorma delicatula TaxID=130591 RepID=UPI003F511E26